jgi:hypothetical protein
MFCKYYQAKVNVRYTWFVGGVFRNEDNLVFERTLDNQQDTLEFLVPNEYENIFLELINDLKNMGYIIFVEKKINRFISMINSSIENK